MGAGVLFLAAEAQAQNLDAGKSPAQIFNDTCAACHRSPRELRQTSPGFLREHYTTGAHQAATMAAYLASVGSDSRAVQQRKPPNLNNGASQADREREREQSKPGENQAALPGGRRPPGEGAKPAAEGGKPAETSRPAAIARSRRPSDSVEAGQPVIPAAAAGTEAPPQAAATPAVQPARPEDFEE